MIGFDWPSFSLCEYVKQVTNGAGPFHYPRAMIEQSW